MMRGPVARAAAGGLTRRRLQTAVIGLVLLVSCGASVLALGLVTASQAPFDHAFTAQRGADVTATMDRSRVSASQVAATAHASGVTAAAGPFPEVTASPQVTGPAGAPVQVGAITIVGRASASSQVDDLALQSGHWPDRPGQIVLATGQSGPELALGLGAKMRFPGLPGKPVLTVVGTANSVTGSADAWVLPAEVAALGSPSAPPTWQMLYRFSKAGSSSALVADAAEIGRMLPAGAVAGTQNYLAARFSETSNTAPFVPFLVAFGVIGMAMSVLIAANVVSGAVVAGYRRIGVLKSIGFTPAQVVGAYTAQVLASALAGCVGGAVLGNLLAIPVLGQAASVYQVGRLGVPAWVDLTVPVAMLCLVAAAALLPSLRAGRLSPVQAIATGRAPRAGRGYAAHRLLSRLPLPRPVTVGLAAPFARPARTALTMTAVLLGATTVTLAVGLSSSLNLVVQGLSHSAAEPVQVQLPGNGPFGLKVVNGKAHKSPAGPVGATRQLPSAAAQQRTVEDALRAQAGTLRYVAQADQLATVAGITQPVAVTAFRGSSGWTGYDMIRGHWYTGPGQADVATRFLTITGTRIGDTVTLRVNGHQMAVKLVGQIFSSQNDGLMMVTSYQTLAAADPRLAPDSYDVALRPGISAGSYVAALGPRLGPDYFVSVNNRKSQTLDIMIGLIGTLTLLLALVAGLGVLNTVVLTTRERVHDLGVFKSIGMSPRQTTVMAVCWVAGTGLIAGIAAVPAGIALHHQVLPAMAAAVDIGLPPSFLTVYGIAEMIVLALAGAAIAIGGALLPASWAAAIRTGTALRAE